MARRRERGGRAGVGRRVGAAALALSGVLARASVAQADDDAAVGDAAVSADAGDASAAAVTQGAGDAAPRVAPPAAGTADAGTSTPTAPPAVDAQPQAPPRAATPATASTRPPPPEQGVTVRDTGSTTRGRSATEYALPVGALAQVPRQSGSDLLTLAPGVMLSNEGTEGHAPHVFLRGFTGDNGQDIQFTVNGVPINEEANVHGQGYADLYFVIPELVARLDVTQGVADPRQGNFAVAGSIAYHLALRQRGVTLRGSYGMFHYARLTALYGPSSTSEDTFVGVDLVRSDGFGPSRDYQRASALAQHRLALGGGLNLRVLAGAYATRFTSPGVVREDDFDAGRVGFFDTYAQAGRQGGFSTRAMVSAALEWRRERDRAELQVFGFLRDFGLRENFTGYLLRRQEGDLIEQRYGGGTVGARGFYARDVPLFGRNHALEVGWFFRHDRYALGQRRLAALTGDASLVPDAADVDADVHATNVALYLDATARIMPWLVLRGGARFDVMAYAVDARGRRPVDGREVRELRYALGTHLAPKATLEVAPARGLAILASYGSGLRSPDALTLADGEVAPFTSVSSQELGVRYTLPAGAAGALRASASLAGYHTLVAQDLLFDPVVGRAVPIGATRRLGAVLWVRVQPWPWLDVNASVTYTRATIESDAQGRFLPPGAQPPPAGSLLPYVPPWVARLDAALDRQVATVLRQALRLRGGLGASYYGPRPLPLDDRSEPVFLLDAAAGARLGPVGLDVSARNLLDLRWRDAQLNFASSYVQGGTPSLFPVRHFTAGQPFTLFATLSLYL